MSRADDLTPLIFPPPKEELGFRQGTVVEFDLSNGTNVIDVGGAQLVDVPLLNVTDSVSLEPGTIVALLTWRSSWWIIGRVIIPDTPGYGDLCAFENNGEGVCLTQNGIDFYPPNPPSGGSSGLGRIFAQHFFDGDDRMWIEIIPPRDTGTTGDNRFILEGKNDGNPNGSFSLITTGTGTIDADGNLNMFSSGGSATLESGTTSDAFVRATDGSTWVDAQSGDGQYLASGNIFVNATQQIQLLSGELSVFIDHDTTSNAANCFIATNGLIQRSTSSLRYKQDVEDVSINPREVINLRPRTWRDKKEVAENPDTDRWHVGLIAEEVDEIGLGIFVDYDEEGQPDSIAYDRLSVALLELIKYQDKRLTDLEERVATLDGSSANPSAPSTTNKPKRYSTPSRPAREDS